MVLFKHVACQTNFLGIAEEHCCGGRQTCPFSGRKMAEHALRKRPKILLSNFTDDERRKLSDQIRSLGGIIYESSNFTSLATHIICKAPSRGEKFICGCVAGKWILPKSYIDESCTQNQWLDEEKFEWTAEHCNGDLSRKDLFSLPRKGRKSQKAIFQNWIVMLLFVSPKKKDSYRRLIEAGGGKVVHRKPPYRRNDMKLLKYVIYEDEKNKELLPFKRAGVPLVNCETVIDFIIKGTDLNSTPHAGNSKETCQKMQTPSPVGSNKSFSFSGRNGYRNIADSSSREKKAKKQTTLSDFFVGCKDILMESKSLSDNKLGRAGISEITKTNDFAVKKKLFAKGNSTTCNERKSDRREILPSNESTNKLSSLSRRLSRLNEEKRETARKIESSCSIPASRNAKHNVKSPVVVLINLEEDKIPSENDWVSLPSCNGKVTVKGAAQKHNTIAMNDSLKGITEKEVDICPTVSASPQKINTSAPVSDLIKQTSPTPSQKFIGKVSVPPKTVQRSIDRLPETNNGVAADNCFELLQNLIEKSPSKTLSEDLLPPIASDQITNSSIARVENNDYSRIVNKQNSSDHETNIKGHLKKESNLSPDRQLQIDRRNATKKRSRMPVEIDVSLLMDTSGPKTRSSKFERTKRTFNVAESPVKKKPKVIKDDDPISKPRGFDQPSLMDPMTVSGEKYARRPLYRNGVNLIEGCWEEGHFLTAVKMMSDYLSPKFYLPAKMVFMLMELLRDPHTSLDATILQNIRSLLHRCILLHPPQCLPYVYLCALRTPVENNGEIKETGDGFEYLLNLVRDFKTLLNGQEQAENISFRKQEMMDLIKFIISFLETDFNHHWKRLESGIIVEKSSKKRPIVAQLLWNKAEATGSGVSSKELIMLAFDLVRESKAAPEMIWLRGMVFRIIRLAAECCQMSDISSVSICYGPASRLFTADFHEIASNYLGGNSKEKQVETSCIFACLRPRWLATRIADLMIGSYDVSKVVDSSRQLLSKPLSKEKIVSCYFHLVPTSVNDSIVKDENKKTKRIPSKPLAVIGDSCTEMSRLNICQQRREKISVKRNVKGETQLHIACIKNKPSDVKQLILNGLDPNLKDNAGWTALHEASNHGRTECVAELIKCKDLDIFATGMEGFSALHDAVANGHLEVAKLLIRAGGSTLLKMKTTTDLSAKDLAKTDAVKEFIARAENRDLGSDDVPKGRSTKKASCLQIEEYLLLLTVLLRNVSNSADKSYSSDFSEKLINLKNHVRSLNNRQSLRTKVLLSDIQCILCKKTFC